MIRAYRNYCTAVAESDNLRPLAERYIRAQLGGFLVAVAWSPVRAPIVLLWWLLALAADGLGKVERGLEAFLSCGWPGARIQEEASRLHSELYVAHWESRNAAQREEARKRLEAQVRVARDYDTLGGRHG